MRSLSKSSPFTPVAALAALMLLVGCPTEEDEPFCGDEKCQLGDGENATTCPLDCEAVCGDSACTGAETHASCARDCPVECGDGSCDGAETFQNCPGDCPAPPVCGDGFCEGGETYQNCPSDCPDPPRCGDGVCEGSETAQSCPGDCAVCTGNFPVDCHDGTGCWSAGTNCTSQVFQCSGLRRCASTADWAFCCGGFFVTCPSFAPYYCPNYGLCYAQGQIPAGCGELSCSLLLGDC
jgi:hypothetical protein